MFYKINHGFTIIEVMISMAILSIGLLAVTSMIVSSGQTSRNSALTDIAVFDAQQEISKIAAAVEKDELTDSGSEDKGICVVNWDCETINSGSETYKVVNINVKEKFSEKNLVETVYLKN
ncbi:MAG: type IV pilus modification PilV family protein [Nanobdellota archaeon]